MIITCGFVSSGTRLLHAIVQTDMGLEAEHRSYPHWDQFWTPDEFPPDTTWIVIKRKPKYALQSALAAGHPGLPDGSRLFASQQTIKSWYADWLEVSKTLPDPYWVVYEELIRSPVKTIDDLAAYLHVSTPLRSYRQIRDENSKYE